MKKPYKIKILGGEEDGNVKGFFSKYQLPQAIALMTRKFLVKIGHLTYKKVNEYINKRH